MRNPTRLAALLSSSFWTCLSTGLVVSLSSIAAADISLPDGTWYYQQRGELLDEETYSGTINPEQFASFAEDKTRFYPPLQFYTGGYIQTVTSTIFAGGKYPAIISDIETTWDNVAWVPGRDAAVFAGMNYNFQAWKKYSWAPDWDVPLTALMAVEVNAYGPHPWFQPRPSSAYASASITYSSTAGTFSEEVTLNTRDHGNDYKQLFKKFSVGLDQLNQASLSTYVLASASADAMSGTWGAMAIADPAIQIDPDAYIEVDGISYKAGDLYGLSFSAGFQAVPEPNLGLGLALGLLGTAAFNRLPRKRRL